MRKYNVKLRMSECHPDRKHAALGLCQRCYIVHYWQANGKRICEQQRVYREENQAKIKVGQKRWYDNNHDSVRNQQTEYYNANSDKIKARVAIYQKANPDKARIWRRTARNLHLAKQFNVSEEELLRLRSAPCEICGSHKLPRLDHDHKTGRLRGTLCHKCNCAIGQLGDNVLGLKKALEYLCKTDANN